MHIQPKALDVEIRLGNPHNALWADSEDRHQEAGPEAQWFGLVVGIRWGTFIQPLGMGGMYDPEYKPWKVFRFPFAFPFISIAVGPYGAYLGAKDYGWVENYVKNGVWTDGIDGERALMLSATARRTRLV